MKYKRHNNLYKFLKFAFLSTQFENIYIVNKNLLTLTFFADKCGFFEMLIFRNANISVLLYIWVLAVSLIVLPKTKADIYDCDFFDTVDISAGQRFPNGSYLYDGLLIPAELTGIYNSRILPDESKEKVESHIRGCVCKLKTCVRFCCPHNHIMRGGVCSKNMTEEELEEHDPYLNVTLKDGSEVTRHFKDELIVQWDLPMPCEDMFYLDNRDEMDQYTLFEVCLLYKECGKINR